MYKDRGKLSCIDTKTGEFVWQENLKGNFGASPVYAEGHIYFNNKKGETTVIAEGREYQLLSSNVLDEGFMASPAVKGNSFILRTKHICTGLESNRPGLLLICTFVNLCI